MDEFVGMDLGTEDDDELTSAIWLHMTMIVVSQGAERPGWRASRPGKRANIFRDFTGAHRRLMLDYFWDKEKPRDDCSGEKGPVYPAVFFEIRFRMPPSLFRKLFSATVLESDYLRSGLRQDCTGKFGASPSKRLSLRFDTLHMAPPQIALTNQ